MRRILFDKTAIECIFEEAQTILMDRQSITEVIYTDFNHETFDANNIELLRAVSGKSMVYCIWAGKSFSELSPVYIGHAGEKISRQRIRSHLTKKNARTGAQLENVKAQLAKGGCIGISIIDVYPAYMRKALEDWLIRKNSIELEWNSIGRRPLKT